MSSEMSIEDKYKLIFQKENYKEEVVISYSEFLKRELNAKTRLLFRMGPYSLDDLPEPFHNVLRNAQQFHPCTQVYLHDKTDGKDFLEKYYPDMVESYHAIIPGAFKSDIIRICLLEKYGGWYADMSILFNESLSMVPENVDMVLVNDHNFRNDNVGVGITNGFMYSKQNNPFIQKMIQHMKKNIQERVYNESCLNITGPVALCNCFKEFFSCPMIDKGTQGIQIFKKDGISYPIFWMDFRLATPFSSIEYQQKLVLQCKFEGYANLMYEAFNAKPYWKLWDERNIYA